MKKEQTDLPLYPKLRPNLPIDIDLIYKKAIYYLDGKKQFAVFENGTVVYFPNKIDNITKCAKESLNKVYNFHADFRLIPMDDYNYIVAYNEHAFTIVFKEEIEKHWDYIDKNHQDGVCSHEVIINGQGRHNIFDKDGKICLFGRTKMFIDAQQPKVIKTFEPQ